MYHGRLEPNACQSPRHELTTSAGTVGASDGAVPPANRFGPTSGFGGACLPPLASGRLVELEANGAVELAALELEPPGR